MSRKNLDETCRSRSFSLNPSSRRREQRILGTLFRQWIQSRDRVPERAIGVDQAIDARLQRALRTSAAAAAGAAAPLRCCRSPSSKPSKKAAQLESTDSRILLPAAIILLEQFEVQMSGKRRAHGSVNLQLLSAVTARQVDSRESARPLLASRRAMTSDRADRRRIDPERPSSLSAVLARRSLSALAHPHRCAQADPASEPAVLAVAKVLPAVVNINTERVVRRRCAIRSKISPRNSSGTTAAGRAKSDRRLQSLGSGFIVDPAGYIVTNQHVVERAADLKIEVTTERRQNVTTRIISPAMRRRTSPSSKSTPRSRFPFIDLNNLSPNLLGQTVIVVGNALGYGSSISRGVLSGMKRDITIDDMEYKNLLQTDAAINPGNSGGPVIDISGRLVGVSSAKMAFTPQGVPTQGLGFAIPAETVRDTVAEFKKSQKSSRRRKPPQQAEQPAASNAERLFGMQLQDLTPDLTDALGLVPGKAS